MKNRAVSVSSILLILMITTVMSTSQLMSTTTNGETAVNDAYAKYSNSQAQSQAIYCGEGESSGINCANNGPQSLGDSTATALTPLQIANPVREEPDKELQVRKVAGEPVSVPPGELGSASAECGPGEVATGGGIFVADFVNTINPTTDDGGIPENQPNTWVVDYFNPGPESVDIAANAICTMLVDAQ